MAKKEKVARRRRAPKTTATTDIDDYGRDRSFQRLIPAFQQQQLAAILGTDRNAQMLKQLKAEKERTENELASIKESGRLLNPMEERLFTEFRRSTQQAEALPELLEQGRQSARTRPRPATSGGWRAAVGLPADVPVGQAAQVLQRGELSREDVMSEGQLMFKPRAPTKQASSYQEVAPRPFTKTAPMGEPSVSKTTMAPTRALTTIEEDIFAQAKEARSLISPLFVSQLRQAVRAEQQRENVDLRNPSLTAALYGGANDPMYD